jgi:transcriptional regulator with XRE-family HTH domain
MEFDPEPVREALRAFMQARGLKAFPWCKKAGIGEGTLRGFLNRETANLTLETLTKLAAAENVTVGTLIGERPNDDRPVRRLNVVRLYSVVRIVGEIIRRAGLDVSPDQHARVVVDMMAFIPGDGEVAPTPEMEEAVVFQLKRRA